MDEGWYMLEGKGICVVRKHVCRQMPGDAVPVASSNPEYSFTNDTNEPLKTFYFARYDR